MIDFHCHLDLYPEPNRVIECCRRRGLYVLSVTTTPSAWQVTSALPQAEDRIRTALGLHPQLAHERGKELGLFDELLSEARYVGEIGLDGSPELRRYWRDQVAVFEHILEACRRVGGRIMSIHSRRASRAVLDRLEASGGTGSAILHWFSGSSQDLDRAISLGCWFSVGPAMLRSGKGRALAVRMPRDRILTESDGPFALVDGRSLMPWEVDQAIVELGSIWGVTRLQAQQILRNNLCCLLQSNGETQGWE